MAVKGNQPSLHRQIKDQFRFGRQFPVEISQSESGHGRSVTWDLRAMEATESIRENWAETSWIIELHSSGSRDGKRFDHCHYFLTTLRTSPEALLRLVRQRWSIENSWHWVRDVLLREDAHLYKHRNGVQVLSILRTVAMNLWRRNGFRSIRAGQLAVAHHIERLLGWIGIPAVAG
jgi:predicted transposase YbfD/YdcC